MKNLLFQYKGGGYDGCMWEWNFCAWDGAGKFLDIFSSGRNGCDKEEDALALLESPVSGKYTYDLTKEEAINGFQRENNEGNVIGVVQKINSATDSGDYAFPRVWFECDSCHAHVEYGEGSSPSGDGGIAISFKEKLCLECYERILDEEGGE